MAPPLFTTKYLGACQAPHGNVLWASGGELFSNPYIPLAEHYLSSDWASGWKGFIDGAIEQGAKAAYDITRTLQRPEPFISGSFGKGRL